MIQPICLGNTTLPSNVFYSPLAGVSDFPYRRLSAKFRPGLQYCEMVKMDALIRYDPSTLHILDYSKDMHPIGAQLVGSKVHIAGQAAKILEELGFDVIDLNCGCPVDKVTKDGSGSGLLKTPEKIGDLLHEIVSAVSIPVTLKVRSGWCENEINAPKITEIAEKAGAKAIAVHGRTRVQGYKGSADWGVIRACKEAANTILVIGNGDITGPVAAERMFVETDCDAILVSRGTMGCPWIVEDIYRHFKGLPSLEITEEFLRQILLDHYREVCSYYTACKVLVEMRRIGCYYFKKGAPSREFRQKISRASSLEEVEELITQFPIQIEDAA